LIQLYPKYLTIILILVSIFNSGHSQSFSESGINLGVKVGGSKLLGEIPYDFSQIIHEFDNKTGFASSFEISKYISPRWEIGAEIGYSKLQGSTNTPEFSAEGNHAGTPLEINDPVEYSNKLSGANLFSRYFFKKYNTESVFIPFVCFGGGFLNYFSKFKYIDSPDDELIFGKGKEGYTKLSTPVFFLGTGFKSSLSSKFHVITSIGFNFVNYDFLDVVHNYDSSGNRIDLLGLYAEFKAGIFYTIGVSGGKSKAKSKNKNSSSSGGSHLPFSR
jgi:hypothetical protein